MKYSYRQSDQIRKAEAKMCLQWKTRKFVFNSVEMGSHCKLWTGREMHKAVIKFDSSAQDKMLWQSFLCSLAQLCRRVDLRSIKSKGGKHKQISSTQPSCLLENFKKHQQILFCPCFYLFLSYLLFVKTCITDLNNTDNMKPTVWPHWKIGTEITLNGKVIRKKGNEFQWGQCKAIYSAKKNKLHK